MIFTTMNNVLFFFVQVHQCNKHFVKKIMPENRDLSSKHKNRDSHFFQSNAALVKALVIYSLFAAMYHI